MAKRRVFISVGRQGDQRQKSFVAEVKSLVESRGFEPIVVPNTYENPLDVVINEVRRSDAALILCFERIYADAAYQFRNSETREIIPSFMATTTWNHMEAAIAKCAGIPTLVIAENGCRRDGVLDNSVQFRTIWVDLDKKSIKSRHFLDVFDGWIASAHSHNKLSAKFNIDPIMEAGIVDIVRSMKLRHLAWLGGASAAVFSAGLAVGKFLK